MANHLKKQIHDILDQIEGKIQGLKEKAKHIAQGKEMTQQIQALERQKRQIEEELEAVGHRVRARWQEGRPHLQEAIISLTKALKLFIGFETKDSTSTTSKSSKKPTASKRRKPSTVAQSKKTPRPTKPKKRLK